MYSKILWFLCVLYILQSRKTLANFSFFNAPPEVLKTVLQGMSLSSTMVSAIEHCKAYSGENRRTCLELYSTEPESSNILQPFPMENCRVFTGDQFRICIEIYTLEQARLAKTPSTETCKNFDGPKYQLCSEMPAPLKNPNCQNCTPEKLRLCILVYLPNSTDSSIYDLTKNETTSTIATTLVPMTSAVTRKPRIKILRRKGSYNFVPKSTSLSTEERASTVASIKVQRRKRRLTTASVPIRSNCNYDYH